MAELALYVGQQILVSLVASAAIQALTPTQKAQGPRLNDRRLQTSTEGVAQPVVFGMVRVAGQLIDGKPEFDELSETENQGGKGGGGVDVTTYTYLATVAVRLCRVAEGTAVVGARRFWADDDVLFDASAGSWANATPVYEGSTIVGYASQGVTLYLGNQTEPDPVLEAIHGVGNTPAYLGQCYMVFDRLDITKWGRFPNISAEVVTAGSAADVVDRYPAAGFSFTRASAVMDAAGTLHYCSDQATSAFGFLSSVARRTREGVVTVSTKQAREVLCAAGTEIAWNRADTVEIVDATTYAVRYSTGPLPNNVIDALIQGDVLYVLTVNLSAPTGPTFRVRGYNTRTGAAVASSEFGGLVTGEWSHHGQLVMHGGALFAHGGPFLAKLDPGTLSLAVATTPQRAQVRSLVSNGTGLYAVTVYGADSLGWTGSVRQVNPSTLALTQLQELPGVSAASAAIDSNTLYVLAHGGGAASLHRVALAENAMSTVQMPELTLDDLERYHIALDAERGVLRAATFDLFLSRVRAETVPASQIVLSLLAEAGVSAENVVVDMPDDPAVVGFMRSRVAAPRDSLTPLAQAYGFDVIDVGHTIKVRARGATPVAVIDEDELLALDGSDDALVEVTLAQESELPSRLNVSYIDRSRTYAPGTQPAQRRLSPSQTVAELELPVVFDGNAQPRDIADRQLVEARLASRAYKFVLPLDYVELEPGDAVTLRLNDGTSRDLLLTRVELAYDALALLCEAVRYDASIYRELPAQVEIPYVPTPAPSPVRLQMLQLPALADTDATAPVAYAAAVPFSAGGWRGAGLFRSADEGATFGYVAPLVEGVVGVCVDALPAGRQAHYVDRTTTLRVSLPHGGALSSTTFAQLLNGSNAAAVLRADGEVEVIQWQTATLQTDGTYVLSNLLNGRQGTEHAMDGHAVGETFVLLSSARLARLVLDTSELDAPRVIAAVKSGTAVANATRQEFTASGRNLLPYSPVRLRGVRDEAGNLTISWTRRSRLRGNWRRGNWSPLGEATERYEVDILNGAGQVLRTLSSTTPSATYTAAEQVADLGAVQGAVAIQVYQLSSEVGRGTPAGATV